MLDVLVVGAGPAGTVAAALLARAGVTVRLVDRARFPRDKFCGDTLNPGVVRMLRRLQLAEEIVQAAPAIDGMIVTGPGGVRVRARYRRSRQGRALLRRDLDMALLREAVAAGAHVDEGVLVRTPIVEAERVCGVTVRGRDRRRYDLRARVTIAADGRRSRLVASLGLASASRVERWAVGGYFSGVGGLTTAGEMHIRPGGYIGVAPITGDHANVCVVTDDRRRAADPAALVASTLREDPDLRDRFTHARQVSALVSTGPLARDVRLAGVPGLLLAGDAAGFIDPMTGDGLRFAVRGGELAAGAALELLSGRQDAHLRLTRRRRRAFGPKWRLNCALRTLVGSPSALAVAAVGARVAPWVIASLVRIAGDEYIS